MKTLGLVRLVSDMGELNQRLANGRSALAAGHGVSATCRSEAQVSTFRSQAPCIPTIRLLRSRRD